MDWHDDELGDHGDDHDASHYEQAGGDLADISDSDIEQGRDVGIEFGVSDSTFADLEPEADDTADLDPDEIGDGDGLSGDEGQADDYEARLQGETDLDALGGSFVLDDALARQIEGSLNTSEMISLAEEAHEFYGVRLIEINGRIKPYGDPEDVQLWLRHVRQGRRHWSKDRRTTVAPLGNSREYGVKDKQDAIEKSWYDRERYQRQKAEGLTRKPTSKSVEQRCHEHCQRKVRAARKTERFRSLLDEDEVKAFEDRVYDEAKVTYMANHLAKEIEAAQKEERKARARGVKSIQLQRGIGRTQANKLWNEMEQRVEELLEIIQKGPNAYNTQKEIDEYAQELAETMAAMREHQR